MKGRKKNESHLTIIKDPVIEPYFISKDNYSFTICKTISSPTTSKNNTDYVKSLGHYSNFSKCLKSIAQYKIDDKKEYSTISEYIKEYEKNLKLMNEIFNTIF